jgi:hypothetical protein
MTLIRVFDEGGRLLASSKALSTARRNSVQCAAWQDQLDGMISRHPAAHHALIGTARFVVENGISQHVR